MCPMNSPSISPKKQFLQTPDQPLHGPVLIIRQTAEWDRESSWLLFCFPQCEPTGSQHPGKRVFPFCFLWTRGLSKSRKLVREKNVQMSDEIYEEVKSSEISDWNQPLCRRDQMATGNGLTKGGQPPASEWCKPNGDMSPLQQKLESAIWYKSI